MALINLRNALMAGKRLPYDAEVEYLAADVGGQRLNTPYIDTGVYLTGWSSVAIGYQEYDTSQYYPGIFSSRKFPVYHNTSYTLLGNDRLDCGYGATASWTRNTNVRHLMLQNTSGALTITLDDSVVRTVNIDNFTSAETTILFADRANVGLKGAIYYFRIWNENGTLVFDGIPVRKGTVGYLYDRVSGKLFGNAGTGDFTCGPDVVPVEYIESHAAEYIDTGAIPDDSTGIEVVHTICTDNEKDNIIFGARQDSGNTRYWSDIDWGANDSIGWGFNTYSGNNERFILTASDAGRIITNSLNFMNDRAGKIDGVTYDSSLQSKTLATINRSIYLFGANNMGTIAIRGTFKVYSAKISKGQTLVNKFLPVRVGSGSTWEGAMMDTLTRRIYRNAGRTGAFAYGNDLKYPIPAS